MKHLGISVDGHTHKGTHFHILGSQVGSMAIYNTDAILKSCEWNYIAMINKVCIDVINSTLIMKLAFVVNFKGGHFIQAQLGRVNITDTKFVNCIAPGVLVFANESVASIENCTFSVNQGALVVLITSVGFVDRSLFKHNRLLQHHHVDLPLLLAVTSLFVVTNSQFFSNTAAMCLNMENGTMAVVNNSDFTDNRGTFVGGIYALQGTLQIDRCTFVDNKNGCIKAKNSSSITISNSMFHNNSAWYGGGLWVLLLKDGQMSGNLEVKNLAEITSGFHLNANETVADRDSSAQTARPEILIRNCSFVKNVAQVGGAIYLSNESLYLDTPKEEDVIARQEHDEFSGSKQDKMWILDSLFTANKAFSFGGAILTGSQSTIAKCTFRSNTASVAGGAVHCRSVTITKCHFGSNSAGAGGALLSQGSDVLMSQTMLSNNTASNQGGAMSVVNNKCFLCRFCSFSDNTAGSR